jgi:WD40 repeat protein
MIWSTRQHKILDSQHPVEGWDNPEVNDLTWSPNGEMLAVVTRRGGFIYNISGGKLVRAVSFGERIGYGDLECVSWSPCGHYLAFRGFQGHLAVYDVARSIYCLRIADCPGSE